MNIPGWLGDIPGWLSIIGAVVIFAVGYARRTKIVDWFKRATNAPPSFESQPSFTARQDGQAMLVTNHGPGDAFDVQFTLSSLYMTGADFRGQYNWNRVSPNETVRVEPTFRSISLLRSAWMTVTVSWILRHDPGEDAVRDSKTFNVDLGPWLQPEEEEDSVPF